MAACSENDPAKAKEKIIVGDWVLENGYSFSLNKDHTGVMHFDDEIDVTWKYDADLDCFTVLYTNGKAYNITYETGEDGNTTIIFYGVTGTKQTTN